MWWWLYMDRFGKCLSLHIIWFNCTKYTPKSFFSLWMCTAFCGDSFCNLFTCKYKPCWITILYSLSYIIIIIYHLLKDVFSFVYFPKELTTEIFCNSSAPCGIRFSFKRQATPVSLNCTAIEVEIQMILHLYMCVGKFVGQVSI